VAYGSAYAKLVKNTKAQNPTSLHYPSSPQVKPLGNMCDNMCQKRALSGGNDIKMTHSSLVLYIKALRHCDSSERPHFRCNTMLNASFQAATQITPLQKKRLTGRDVIF